MAEGAIPHDHLVRVYRDRHELADSAAAFFSAGFAAGDAAVSVATAAHRPPIVDRLARAGWDPDELERTGRIVWADAQETLASICEDGKPSLPRFTSVVGDLLDRATGDPPRPVRVFGEMVDILCRRGDPAAADSLEGMWNAAGATRDFTLLCGYKVDLFDLDAQVNLLPQVYRAHSEVLPATDPTRLDRALDGALVHVLGEAEAKKVHDHVASDVRCDRMPPTHLALLWIATHMPRTADRILTAARVNYLTAAAATPLPTP